MEEKLYFEPELLGKKKEKQKKSKKKALKFLKLFIFLLLLTFIILAIIWLLKGSKTISGQYPESIRNDSLTCESTEIDYPKISSVKSNNKKLQINLIFLGNSHLKSASLVYSLYYTNPTEVTGAEAFAHAEFNKGLYEIGFDVDKFSNKFARFDDRLIISLFANSSDITEYTASYYMIKTDGKLPDTIEEFRSNYVAQGFTCQSTNQ